MIAVERHVADNEVERNHKRILEIIRSAGKAGVTKSELSRRSQFIDQRPRDEIIATLVEAELITTFMHVTSTKPALAYRALERRA